jgi:hypothetical protein
VTLADARVAPIDADDGADATADATTPAKESGVDADAATSPAEAGMAANGDAGVCATRSGSFLCSLAPQPDGGYAMCDRASELCGTENGKLTGCLPYTNSDYWTQSPAALCGPCPTCACLSAAVDAGAFGYMNTVCEEDDAGSLFFEAVSHSGCYGAPPARGPRRRTRRRDVEDVPRLARA